MAAEIDALSRAREAARPLVAIVGGSKCRPSSRSSRRSRESRSLIVGRHREYLSARGGKRIGKSLAEPSSSTRPARSRRSEAERRFGAVPTDVVCGEGARRPARRRQAGDQVAADDLILDIGPRTAATLADILAGRHDRLERAGRRVSRSTSSETGRRRIAGRSPIAAFSIAGGGDTLAPFAKYGVAERSPISRPAAALSSNFSKDKNLPRSKFSSNGRHI
jgi:phosphoglycerate kinase